MSSRFSKVTDKIEELTTVEGLKKNWALLAVISIFSLALWLRYRPEQGMQYLQALDPYILFRMSRHLALEGNFPVTDFARYFPYNNPAFKHYPGVTVLPAIFYWLGPFLFFESFLEWAQFYPALMGALGVLMAYFLGKELWNKTAGISGAFFLAVIAGAMHRTSAGFFEKEPIGTFLMMVSLYFFVRGWKYKEQLSGVFAGIALGLFHISWGGGQMLFLLYPLVVGLTIMLNEDIRSLVAVYTPTVLLAVAIAHIFRGLPLTNQHFLTNLGVLGLLWMRYSVEELDLIKERNYQYFVPTVSALGLVALILSPLYSDFLASQVMTIINRVSQTTSSTQVIAGTVAENTPATLGQMLSQLGAVGAGRFNQTLGMFSHITGTWPLAFIGTAVLGTSVLLMILRKYGFVEKEIQSLTYYKAFVVTFVLWVLGFATYFKDNTLVAIGPSVLMVMAGLGFLYSIDAFDEMKTIDFEWYQILPFLWVVSNILGAANKSRLVFLATFSVAMTSGFMFSTILYRLRKVDYTDIDPENSQKIKVALIGIVILAVALPNLASGYVSSSRLGGSPNQLWMDNMDYMQNQTEPGEVMMSWWDYGYWFETIGHRPAIADGNNAGYYSDKTFGKINYPLADYLTATDPDRNTTILEKHSVDYIVLDHTMIGKYSAVSQISNRNNNQFNSMIGLSSPRALQNSVSENNGNQVAVFRGRGLQVYAPIESTQTSVSLAGAPTLETSRGRGKIDCILTENGKKTFNVSRSAPYCLAEDPFRSFERGLQLQQQSRVVLVPKEISEANLVRLYLMDGYGIDYAEKVPEGSNGYVKMWEVTGDFE